MTAVSYHDTVNDLQGLAFAGQGPFARREWFTLLENAGAKQLNKKLGYAKGKPKPFLAGKNIDGESDFTLAPGRVEH